MLLYARIARHFTLLSILDQIHLICQLPPAVAQDAGERLTANGVKWFKTLRSMRSLGYYEQRTQ